MMRGLESGAMRRPHASDDAPEHVLAAVEDGHHLGDVVPGVTAEGRDAIHAFVSSFLTPFSDGTYATPSAFANEDQAAVA
jgi:phage baseplate assembly protein gpV